MSCVCYEVTLKQVRWRSLGTGVMRVWRVDGRDDTVSGYRKPLNRCSSCVALFVEVGGLCGGVVSNVVKGDSVKSLIGFELMFALVVPCIAAAEPEHECESIHGKVVPTSRQCCMLLTTELESRCLRAQSSGPITTLLPTSRENAGIWRYTFQQPLANWYRVDFDDSTWEMGRGGFGTEGTPNTTIGTTWNSQEVWLRRSFEIRQLPQEEFYLQLQHDEDVTVYLNGVKAAEVAWFNTDYSLVPVLQQAQAALRDGVNTIAVHCRQTTGGQYVDVGLIALKEDRWSRERAWKWYGDQAWPCGFNYIPATAISYTEMFMPYCFDPELIDRELALAENIGFNCLRVVLPFVVWEHDPQKFRQRLDAFLTICEKRRLKVMFSLFDDCAFGSDPKLANPWYGRQPDVLEGWYANGWTPSPGHEMVRDPETWPRLEDYVRDIVGTFQDDKRVWVWDLYNEPGGGGLGDVSCPLVEKVFQWARDVDPSQPLTVAQYSSSARLNSIIFRHSDIISFHNYGDADGLVKHIAILKEHGRPVVNTEWLNRGRHSLVETCLPVFAAENVGCMHWGLVNGKTQTDLHWGWRPGKGEPEVWQHDLFHQDHRPYRIQELDLFRRTIRDEAVKEVTTR
jgi:hypothetical protein